MPYFRFLKVYKTIKLQCTDMELSILCPVLFPVPSLYGEPGKENCIFSSGWSFLDHADPTVMQVK